MAPALSEAENYHAWMHSWIAPYVSGQRVLDIGSGTGNHLRFLSCPELVSVDVDAEVVAYLRARYASRSRGWRFEHLDLTAPMALETLGAGSFDVVLSSNVFEHVVDDSALFRASYSLLRPGGRLVLLLPAHQMLFGSLDRIAGHHRRYDARMLKDRLSAAGFTLGPIRYVNFLGAIGWFVNSRILRYTDIRSSGIGWQVRLFDRVLVPVLRRVEGTRRLPFGQSIAAVGEKPRPEASHDGPAPRPTGVDRSHGD